jgi:hypothetical protein
LKTRPGVLYINLGKDTLLQKTKVNMTKTTDNNMLCSIGLATITVLNIAAYMMLLGIYNSATLVSTNNNLRKSIRKHALESRLLNLIGHAEMENEIQRTVKKIAQDKDRLEIDTKLPIELDEKELKKYVDLVIREVKKDGR